MADDEKDKFEFVLEPLEEGTKHHHRKSVPLPKVERPEPKERRKTAPLNELNHSGGVKPKRPPKSKSGGAIEDARKIREIEISTGMYNMILDGKSEKDIADAYKCSVQLVRRYLDMKLQEAQEGLLVLQAKTGLIGYQRIEKYVIAPAIAKINKMIEEGQFDARVYETLMKGIKLEAELLAPKTTVNVQNNGGSTYITNGTSFYNEIAEAMRQEESELGGIVLNAEDVELSEYKIKRVEDDNGDKK